MPGANPQVRSLESIGLVGRWKARRKTEKVLSHYEEVVESLEVRWRSR